MLWFVSLCVSPYIKTYDILSIVFPTIWRVFDIRNLRLNSRHDGGMPLQAEGAKWKGITFWSACHCLQVLWFKVKVFREWEGHLENTCFCREKMPDVPWFQRMSLDSMGSGLKNSSSCFQIVAIRLRYVISSIRINTLFERSIITVWKLIK